MSALIQNALEDERAALNTRKEWVTNTAAITSAAAIASAAAVASATAFTSTAAFSKSLFHLLLHLEEQQLARHGTRVLDNMMIEDRACSHGSGDASLRLDGYRVRIVHVAVRVDGELVALEDVDEVILVMVKAIHIAGLHLHHSGDPIVVFGENLITFGGDRERGDETRNVAARHAQWVLLDKQHERLGVADVLHLSCHGSAKMSWQCQERGNEEHEERGTEER